MKKKLNKKQINRNYLKSKSRNGFKENNRIKNEENTQKSRIKRFIIIITLCFVLNKFFSGTICNRIIIRKKI